MDLLSDIAVFVQVVDSGSFTAAAERLELSRSVISKYISRLEQQLGVRLLNRTTRRLSLTEAGQILYQRSQLGLEAIAEAQQEVAQLQQTPAGRLRINSPMSFGILHIAPLLAEFQQRYPQVKVDMNLDDRQIDLVEAGFDLGIRIATLGDSSLVAKRMAPCRHVLCAAADYLAAQGTPHTPEQLSTHRSLVYGYHDAPNQWQLGDADGSRIQVPLQGALRMNNSLALREAALQGAGIVLIPTFIVGDDIRAGRLIRLLPEYALLEVSIYAVYPQRQWLSPKVRAFIDFMHQALPARAAAWDAFDG